MSRATELELRAQFTIGVEEEYQLVAPGTGELRNQSGRVKRADRTGEVTEEVQDTMLEIGTPICLDAAEVAARLRERRFQAAAAAASEDLEILAAGTHPFSSWEVQGLTVGARPRMLAGLFGQLLRQQSIWGLHVHVAIPPELDRVALMNTVRTYGAHLLALSCSSPFHLGTDSGFDSFRTVTWRGFPFVGVPPRFESGEEFRDYVDLLLMAGTIPDARTLYWSVRPSSRYPTLELRMCDACPRVAEAVAIAALARAIVVASAFGALYPLGASLSPSLQDEVLRENEWLAARDGLDAVLISPENRRRRLPIRAAIDELLGKVTPVAEQLGDADALRPISTILAEGNAADRIREHASRGRSLPQIVDWLVQETRAGTGLDRRATSREDPGAEPVPAP
ncbi:MAG TPA: YbdK family carboxylate-amine ligase [Longimicrobiaceae bacterium]|nr:YbdK family carboxylate-amine ligase [Longimicrobiaceae bacterium]